MNFGSQILILNAVEFFAALNNTCISDRTIVLLLPWLQTINKINLPELFIRIFNPLASYVPVTKAKILRLHYRNLIEKTGVERNKKLKNKSEKSKC